MASTSSSVSTSDYGGSKQHCYVPMCNSNSRYDPSLSFHHFPKDNSLKKQWITKIRRDEGPHFKITNSTVVCSKHFSSTDYAGWTPVRKKLRKYAVPSVFDWTAEQSCRRPLHRKVLSMPHKESTSSLAEESIDDEEEAAQQMETTETEESVKDKRSQELERKLKVKEEECLKIKKQLDLQRFGINRFTADKKLISFYTGFSSYQVLLAFYECIEPNTRNMQSMYYQSSDTINLSGRKRNMLLIDELCSYAI